MNNIPKMSGGMVAFTISTRYGPKVSLCDVHLAPPPAATGLPRAGDV